MNSLIVFAVVNTITVTKKRHERTNKHKDYLKSLEQVD